MARRGARRTATRAEPSATDALLAAFATQELASSHELTITPQRPAARAGTRRRIAAPRAAIVDLAVDVGPNESAVVLVEQDGEYSWHFPEPAATRPSARRRAARPEQVTISIHLTPPPAPSAEERRRLGIGRLFGKAKAWVLKFVARTAAGVALRYLERNVTRGLVVMEGCDPSTWRTVDGLDDLGLTLPDDEPLRILLWVHGTFSSTRGSFGALTATPDGLLLLQQARERYHAVIGFDHATLSDTPLENAVDLVERLGRFGRPMQIDAVTFSRGGLVFRSLLEHLLPTSTRTPEIGQVVYVGVPNHGTLLAEPANWHRYIDLHTNLAVGAFRLLRLLPVTAPAARILEEIVSGLGAFVKYLADVAVTERVVPGLAAQQPSGEFVRALNESGPNQPVPESCRYLAVTASFDAGAALAKGEDVGLANSFLRKLADGFVDGLMQTPNDLVVNTDSMTRIDPEAGDFIDASLDFDESPTVFHTVYFAQSSVATQLRGWLLDERAREGMRERHGLLSVRLSPRSPFTRVRFHEQEGRRPVAQELPAAAPRHGARKGALRPARRRERSQGQVVQAASEHLLKLFGVRSAAPMPDGLIAREGVTEEIRARAYAPGLREESVQRSPMGGDDRRHVVSFAQMHRSIPIFGSRAMVELDDATNLRAARAKLAKVADVGPTPTLSPEAALRKLFAGTRLGRDESAVISARIAAEPPSLTFFHDREQDRWHLAYLFSDIPSVPKSWGRADDGAEGASRRAGRGVRKAHPRHGRASSPRERMPRLDYLVDANDGRIVYYYSVAPTAAAKLPAAIFGSGDDEDGVLQQIRVSRVSDGFELHDALRRIRTYDFGGGDIDTAPPPTTPIRSADPAARFVAPAAVTAHANAAHVYQFFNDLLLRQGVDDSDSYLENLVNCCSALDEDPPTWGNAVWWNNRMWYGQVKVGRKLRSLATHIDIMAHELTHGVTEHTCNLVYRDEAGALNESFSDIFGVIVKNRVRGGALYANPDRWDWTIGSGLGERGRPLRDLSNPALTGDPAHTDEIAWWKRHRAQELEYDFGGVHIFSGIHNRAAYHLLTARKKRGRGKGPLVFTPDEVAQLYYWTLQRLDRVATFEDVFETLSDVVTTAWPARDEQEVRLAAVRTAYGAVGIPRAV